MLLLFLIVIYFCVVLLELVLYCYFNMQTINKTCLILSYLSEIFFLLMALKFRSPVSENGFMNNKILYTESAKIFLRTILSRYM